MASYPSLMDGGDDWRDEMGRLVKDVESDGECDSNSMCKLLMCLALR